MNFRWGVALVGEFSTRHYSPRHGKIFSSTRGTLGEDTNPRTQLRKRPKWGPFMCFVIFWIEYPVLVM